MELVPYPSQVFQSATISPLFSCIISLSANFDYHRGGPRGETAEDCRGSAVAFAVLTANTSLSATMEDLWTDPDGTHSFSFSSGAEETFRVIDDDGVFDDYGPNDTNQVVAPQSTIFTDNAPVASRHKFDVTPDNGDPPFTVYVVFESSTSNDDYSPLNTLNYALVSDTPMIAGVNYAISNRSGDGTVNYSEFSDLVVCYASGTLLETPEGARAVEALAVGDLVVTKDHGPQKIRWIYKREQTLKGSNVETKPVLIKAGALGTKRPERDLVVSPQHRILVGAVGQLEGVFESEALVPSKSLTSLPGIRHMCGRKEIAWYNFSFDRHEIVTANGSLSESLLLGPMVMKSLNSTQCEELRLMFGSSRGQETALNGFPARECMSVGASHRYIATSLKAKRKILPKPEPTEVCTPPAATTIFNEIWHQA